MLSPLPVLFFAIASLSATSLFSQELIGYWSFNNTGLNSGQLAAVGHLPDSGNGFLRVDPEWDRSGPSSVKGLAMLEGSVENSIDNTPGLALGLMGGIGENVGDTPPTNNGKWFQIEADLTGYLNPILSFALRRSLTSIGGFDNNRFSYSTDGTTFTNFGGSFDAGGDGLYRTFEFDLSSVDVLDGDSSVFLRVTFDGATTIGGHNRLDNVQLIAAQAIPEGAITGLFGLSLAGAVSLFRRRAG